jgi:sugar (pentulose or hexulose) kinase
MSGGQVTNKDLMRTFAEVCGVDVVLPEDPSAPVVLGAAMLGRLAHVVMMAKEEGEDVGKEQQAKKLWDIMVDKIKPWLTGLLTSPIGRNDPSRDHHPSRSGQEGKKVA